MSGQVTGKLLADFTSFYDATQKAVVELRTMESGASTVESRLNKMADSLSGRKLVADATLMVEAVERIGGVSKLTAAELARVSAQAGQASEKLRAIGKDVPPGLQKIADAGKDVNSSFTTIGGTVAKLAGAFGITFSIGAVVQFGRSILDTAESLVKLSNQTGIAIDDLQRLEAVAAANGNTLDDLTGAALKLQTTLANPKAQAVIREMGIDFQALKAAEPYEQLRMIAEGFKTIEGNAEQVTAATDLFGDKLGREILPTLRSEFDKLAQSATVSGDATVRALEAASSALDRFMTSAKNAAVGTAGAIVLAGEAITDRGLFATLKDYATSGTFENFFKKMVALGVAAKTTAPAVAAVKPPPIDPLTAYEDEMQALADAYVNLTERQRANIQAGDAAGKSATEIAGKLDLSVDIVQMYINALKDSDAAQKKATTSAAQLAESQAELDSAGQGWKGTLEGINGATQAAVRYYLEAGVSQKALGDVYGLTATQVKAVEAALKAETDALKEEAKSIKEVAALWRDAQEEKIARTATANEAQIAAINRWFAEEVAKLDQSNLNYQTHYDTLEAIAADKLAAVGINWDTLRDGTVAAQEEIAANHQKTYDAMLAAVVGTYTPEAIAAQKKITEETKAELAKRKDANAAYYAEIDAMMHAAYMGAADKAKQAAQTVEEKWKAAGEGIEAGWQRAGLATDTATQSVQRYGAAIQQVTSAQYEMLAKQAEFDANYNRTHGGGGAFWSSASVASQQEQAAKIYREQAAIAGQREAYMSGGGPAWGNVNVTIDARSSGERADGTQLAGDMLDGLRRQGVRFGS